MTIQRQNLLFVLAMLVAVDALYGLGLLGTDGSGSESSQRSDLGDALVGGLPFYVVMHVIALCAVAIAWMSAKDGEVGRAEQLDRIETAARERSRP